MENNDFNEYMEFFKGLQLKEKQDIIIEQLKMLTSFSHKMCEEYKIDNDILINKELVDLNTDDYTEDDFAEAVITYINSIQNSLSDYNIGISNMLEKKEMINEK